ncbi:hypothetical protein AZI86_12550 [Bdellovibrio bacteriovorus]|uniref:Peptidase S1 domain-containing protein n=1 Tax=Bdellovibrio bacteriovorus TaxID=959 RepID=A0A150WIZ4_BDEBC|nr:trypsin-like serine protease [Bdellovibrio bacteriovorus]KYG63654.1 hypothetical protein AZI86_12550 [Bdellovibrio bacteriovorus]
MSKKVMAAILGLLISGCTSSSVRNPAMIGGSQVRAKSGVFLGDCSGTMIAPHIILTAGHCVYSYKESRELGPLLHKGREILINSFDGPDEKNIKRTFIVEIDRTEVHPSWKIALKNPQKSADVAADAPTVSDVGLVFLKQKLPVETAVLPGPDLLDQMPSDVIGFAVLGAGCTRRGDDFSAGAMKGALYNRASVKSHKVLVAPQDAITEAPAGPCKKDSGGGAFLLDKSAKNFESGPVVGVSSIMAGTAEDAMREAPTAFYIARIDRKDVLEWIQSKMKGKAPKETAPSL